MNLHIDVERVIAAHDRVRADLLAERTLGGHWVGELASSPLATATAISALTLAHGSRPEERHNDLATASRRIDAEHVVRGSLSELIVESLHWLAQRQNDDGGWGDTDGGRSNPAATMLVQAAFRLTCVPAKYEGMTERAEEYIESQGGVAALKKWYGRDKTMLAPVLATSALAGLLPWRQVPALPFELACLPQAWHPRLRLPVVSCAIPALVAVGQLKFHHDSPQNPATRLARMTARKPSLAAVARMQPESGGFLEATPLTSFVVMSLASMGLTDHPIVERGIEFLLASVRSDASWPIDTNLATWNTTLAMNALASNEPQSTREQSHSSPDDVGTINNAWHETLRTDELNVETVVMHAAPNRSAHDHEGNDDLNRQELKQFDEKCLDWLLGCQRFDLHPATGAKPGGWSWTDLAGGAPDADNTAGALLALAHRRDNCPPLKQHRLRLAARHAVEWLLELQNTDGGWPTFCRGWSALPFDRSASDLTAHVIRALAVWQRVWKTDPPAADNLTETSPATLDSRLTSAINAGVAFLAHQQRNDGSFVPLWFGNQHHPEGHNLVYGTARVLSMCAELGTLDSEMAQHAACWLLGVQHANGGWGPPRSSPATSLSNIYRPNAARAEDALASFCSVEETALAIEALLPLAESNQLCARSVQNGLNWLMDAVEQGRLGQPAPIGFYFAKLWYHERLYPMVFAASALNLAVHQLAPQRAEAVPVG